VSYRGVVLDVDGTVLRGDRVLAGARAGLAAVDAAGCQRLFVTNNPTRGPEGYAERFERAGLSVASEEVVTAGETTVAYLRAHHADDALYVLGEAGLCEQLDAAGFARTDDPDAADCLVASIDRSFDYDDLTAAMWALSDGTTAFVGTDPDVVIPAGERDVPGSGAVVRAVEAVAGRAPDAVLGKPSATARRVVADRLAVPPEECLVVGDRPDTDVAFGNRAGMTTALVTTGVTDASAAAAAGEDDPDCRPDLVLESLAELSRVLGAE
jgi:4-nitrophenyl phosphatase